MEFLGTNLRKCNFEGAHFKDTVFVGALLNGCNFKGATFENVVFVNTSVQGAKGLNFDEGGITVLKQYPSVDISPALKAALDGLRENPHVGRFKVLHLTTQKYNQLNLSILLASFSEEQLILGLIKAKDEVKKDMCTVSCLKEYLSRSLRL